VDDKEVFYTDVPSKLVKMRNGVINPNFDNIDTKFFFCFWFDRPAASQHIQRM